MRALVKKHEKTLHVLKLCVLLLLPIILSFVSVDKLEGKQTICLVKNIFGFECYGCGITKAVISAIQLDFVRAFNFNKLIAIVFPLIIYLWGREIITGFKTLKKRF